MLIFAHKNSLFCQNKSKPLCHFTNAIFAWFISKKDENNLTIESIFMCHNSYMTLLKEKWCWLWRAATHALQTTGKPSMSKALDAWREKETEVWGWMCGQQGVLWRRLFSLHTLGTKHVSAPRQSDVSSLRAVYFCCVLCGSQNISFDLEYCSECSWSAGRFGTTKKWPHSLNKEDESKEMSKADFSLYA